MLVLIVIYTVTGRAAPYGEVLGSCMMTASLCMILLFLGVDFVPGDVAQASFAWGASVLLGFGMGIINAIIAMAFPGWITVMFVPDALPEIARYYLSFNPVLHAVEWMRWAYYPDYGSLVLDKTYLLYWGIGTVFVGLGLERLLRGRLLSG